MDCAEGGAWSRHWSEAEKAFASGNFGLSQDLFKMAVELAEAESPDSTELAICLVGLAQTYSAQLDYQPAEELYGRALAIFEKRLAADHPTLLACLKDLGLLYQVQGRSNEAEGVYLRVLGALDGGQSRAEALAVLTSLCEIYRDELRVVEAERSYGQLIELTEALHGSEHPELALHLIELGELRDGQGAWEKAEESLRQAFKILRKTRGPNHPQSMNCLKRLLEVQEKLRKKSESARLDITWI